MPNSLTRTAGLQLGPVVFETLLKHYFDRVKKEKAKDGIPVTQLRQDELLYDAAFNIVKRFLDVSTHHSVEELQAFSNTGTPTPPWVHSVQVIVPISCCDQAAALVIQALGGEEQTIRLVGGTKWWQVRGVNGVTGEWVTARKDWQESEKRRKAFEQKTGANNDPLPPQNGAGDLPSSGSVPSSGYDEGMDEMRCVLYSHGGGYYFGSLDQERYCIQRYARKIRGRVLAVNYRLAPQYPFPCALQDLVAAYLYLIKPPPEAPHQPVKPAHIVVAGDSAGGGLALSFLQVLRDTGQPLPAGGVLISPWCDLTHSFPSIHTNTATDVLPVYGLSLHKPSALWPPPSKEMTQKVHRGLRRRIREIVRVTITGNDPETASQQNVTRDALAGSRLGLSGDDGKSVSSDIPIDVGTTVSLPSVDEKEHQTISLEAKSGEHLRIDSQIQLYAENSLLGHPLVSPALSYLGGLPPLFVIASDKEVLRDEIMYSAHKAADPSRFPLKDEARALYPPLVGIEERHCPTHVHLQVYDDTAHVLPVLFPFSTPGKYCYRALATFTKHVTGMLNPMKPSSSSDLLTSSPYSFPTTPMNGDLLSTPQILRAASTTDLVSPARGGSPIAAVSSASIAKSPRVRALSSFTRPTFSFRMKSLQAPMPRSSSEKTLPQGRSSTLHSQTGQDVGSPAKLRRSVSMPDTRVRYAGEPSVYYDEQGLPSWKGGMIRERVSTQGIIRPMEPAEQLDAMHVPIAILGVLSERAMRRYLEGKSVFDKKYAKEMLAVEKERNRNIDIAKKDITKNLTRLEGVQNGKVKAKAKGTTQVSKDGIESPIGTWGWALADERPPPSSIVSRRDTIEARRLVRIADLSVPQNETHHMSGNNLWTVIMNLLTTTPGKEEHVSDSEAAKSSPKTREIRKSKSLFASLRQRRKEAEEQK